MILNYQMKINKQQYNYARRRIEELLPYVSNETPIDDPRMIELDKVSRIVERYEKEHYNIEDLEVIDGKVVKKKSP